MTDAESRQRVLQEALSWVGTPWVHAARVKGAGVDCGQFLAEVYQRAGVRERVDTPSVYPQDWALHRSEALFVGVVEQYARKVPEGLPGDMALFRFGRCVSHGAIVLEWPRIIHAYLNRRSVVEDSLEHNSDLVDRFAGFWRPNAWR